MPTPFVLSSDLVSAYPAKSVEIADYIDGYKLDTGPVQNAQTGTTYTFALSDTTKTVTANNAAASAYTVPPQSAVVWEDYTTLRLLNLGAGVVTLTAGAGVTINGTATVAQYSSATLVRTASNTWTVAVSGAAPGMVLITPTSVAGSGVTLSGGEVSFAAAASININGCFTSQYDNYAYELTITASSVDNQIRGRVRLAGTDSSVSYKTQRIIGYGTTIQADTAAFGTTSWFVTNTSTLTAETCAATGTIFSPALARETLSLSNSMTVDVSANQFAYQLTKRHAVSTAYDGLTLFTSAGTITGKIRIYGLRNS